MSTKHSVIGKIIHYVDEDGVCHPALINRRFTSELDIEKAAITVFNRGFSYYPGVAYSEEKKPHTWHWIEEDA